MNFNPDTDTRGLWESWSHSDSSRHSAAWPDDLLMLDGEVGSCLDLIFAPSMRPDLLAAALSECEVILSSARVELDEIVPMMDGPEREYFDTLREIVSKLTSEASGGATNE